MNPFKEYNYGSQVKEEKIQKMITILQSEERCDLFLLHSLRKRGERSFGRKRRWKTKEYCLFPSFDFFSLLCTGPSYSRVSRKVRTPSFFLSSIHPPLCLCLHKGRARSTEGVFEVVGGMVATCRNASLYPPLSAQHRFFLSHSFSSHLAETHYFQHRPSQLVIRILA